MSIAPIDLPISVQQLTCKPKDIASCMNMAFMMITYAAVALTEIRLLMIVSTSKDHHSRQMRSMDGIAIFMYYPRCLKLSLLRKNQASLRSGR